MVIRVLNEVRVREDEYELIKSFSTRIQGLPSSFLLATRERRLLFRGPLHLVYADKDNCETGLPTPALSQCYSHIPKTPGTYVSDRSSRLANAIHQWDTRRERSGSTSSSSTGMTFNSVGTALSGDAFDIPVSACSTFPPSYRISVPQGWLNSAGISGQNKTPASPSPNPRYGPTPLEVFVFTDLVLLATPALTLTPENSEWTLLKNTGIVRVLGINETIEQGSYGALKSPIQEPNIHFSDQDIIILDALPVDVNQPNQALPVDNGSLVTFRLSVPSQQSTSGSESEKPHTNQDIKRSWISAFQRCFRYTLYTNSVPSHPRYDHQLDLALDTHQTVASLLASGLPLPKSPSVQAAEMQDGRDNDPVREEREERGWWSVRFQQVFRELQRQNMALVSFTTMHQ